MKFSHLLFTVFFLLLIITCKHDPVIPNVSEGVINPVDTTETDTSGNNNPNIIPCDPDSVYFEKDIKPLIISSCAISGCHDAITQEDGVNLSSYSTIMEEVQAGNAQESDLFNAIYWPDFDPDKLDELMPQNSNTGLGDSLDLQTITMIEKWINQGAKNNFCSDCDTSNISFSDDILPILNRSCNTASSCHGANSSNPIWDDYQTVNNNLNKFQIRVIDRTSNPMPPSGPLPNCDMNQLKSWIENGAPKN